MKIEDGQGKGILAGVTRDNRLRAFAVISTIEHEMVEAGEGFNVPLSTAAVDTTDNVLLHMLNETKEGIDLHHVVVCASSAGLWTLERGRSYSGGGVAIVPVNLNGGSAKTVSMPCFGGADLALVGTAVSLVYFRTAPNEPVAILNLLLGSGGQIEIQPNGTFAVRFQADAGTPAITVDVMFHGHEPWED